MAAADETDCLPAGHCDFRSRPCRFDGRILSVGPIIGRLFCSKISNHSAPTSYPRRQNPRAKVQKRFLFEVDVRQGVTIFSAVHRLCIDIVHFARRHRSAIILRSIYCAVVFLHYTHVQVSTVSSNIHAKRLNIGCSDTV